MTAESPKKPGRLRWKRTTARWGPETFTLSRGPGTQWLAVVQKHNTGPGWFWYGGGRNTCNQPPMELEAAKAAAMAHVVGDTTNEGKDRA